MFHGPSKASVRITVLKKTKGMSADPEGKCCDSLRSDEGAVKGSEEIQREAMLLVGGLCQAIGLRFRNFK
jgi:hypothetical protein